MECITALGPNRSQLSASASPATCLLRLIGCVSRNNETEFARVALKNHEGSFATRLTVLVYWRQARPQELFSAALRRVPFALILCTTSELRPIVLITPLLLEEESACGYMLEASLMMLG